MLILLIVGCIVEIYLLVILLNISRKLVEYTSNKKLIDWLVFHKMLYRA